MHLLMYAAAATVISQAAAQSLVLPLQLLYPREVNSMNSTAATAGIASVAWSSDRQSYYTLLNVGDISFRVALDTASSDLWIVSSDCKSQSCNKLPRYPLGYSSQTFVPVNNNATALTVGYADGTAASGFAARETIHFANLTVANQTFGLINQSNVTLKDEVSGILGLGFPRLSSVSNTVANSTPFFANLAQQGLIQYPIFGLSLTRNDSGTITFGAVDSTVMRNPKFIHWNRVVDFAPFGAESNTSSYLQWAIPLDGVSFNATQLTPLPTYANNTGNRSLALIDIGSSGIIGPFQDVARLFAQIDGSRLVDEAGQWAVPCDTTTPLSLFFGGQNYTVDPSDYLIGPASGDPNLCLTWPHASLPSSDGIDWQIGTPFLRNVYSIFSFGINTKEPPLIGLYPLNNATAPPETPDEVAALLSSISATVTTTLPNFLIPTPTYTTPAYVFNTSVSHLNDGVAKTGLATSTYEPILSVVSKATALLPGITPSPTLATFLITDHGGLVETSVSKYVQPTLGVPPGWNAAFGLKAPSTSSIIPGLIIVWTITDILLRI